MAEAMECGTSGTTSINKAADLYGVPKTTLKDRLSGRVIPGSCPGPKPYLQSSEETELASHLLSASSIGLGKTRYEVMRIAEGVAKSKGVLRGEQITHGWWKCFVSRNPSLSLRTGDATAGVRIDAVNEESMREYFALLREVYDEFIDGHPERIYNMDEMGMPLDPCPPKLLHKKAKGRSDTDALVRNHK